MTSKGKRRTLGGGRPAASGGPIFEQVVQAVWQYYAPRTALAPPSAEARRQLVAVPINYYSGDQVAAGTPNAFTEYLRAERGGGVTDTQYDLVSRAEAESYRYYQGGSVGYDDGITDATITTPRAAMATAIRPRASGTIRPATTRRQVMSRHPHHSRCGPALWWSATHYHNSSSPRRARAASIRIISSPTSILLTMQASEPLLQGISRCH